MESLGLERQVRSVLGRPHHNASFVSTQSVLPFARLHGFKVCMRKGKESGAKADI